MLLEITKLRYYGVGNKFVLFKWDYYDTKRGIKIDKHGPFEVWLNSCLSINEPFILAQEVQQVYYTSYLSRRDRHD